MRTTARLDRIQRHKLHVEYCDKAKAWALKGLKYVEAGQDDKARAAYEHAQRWHQKALNLEPKAAE